MRRGTSRFASAPDFQVVADCYARQDLLRLLGVSSNTLQRWLDARARIPWAAYQLAYQNSKYGLAERDAAEQFNRRMLTGLAEALQARVTQLEHQLADQARLVDWGCANDPFIYPTDPRCRAV
jgi:hypothetical protein